MLSRLVLQFLLENCNFFLELICSCIMCLLVLHLLVVSVHLDPPVPVLCQVDNTSDVGLQTLDLGILFGKLRGGEGRGGERRGEGKGKEERGGRGREGRGKEGGKEERGGERRGGEGGGGKGGRGGKRERSKLAMPNFAAIPPNKMRGSRETSHNQKETRS